MFLVFFFVVFHKEKNNVVFHKVKNIMITSISKMSQNHTNYKESLKNVTKNAYWYSCWCYSFWQLFFCRVKKQLPKRVTPTGTLKVKPTIRTQRKRRFKEEKMNPLLTSYKAKRPFSFFLLLLSNMALSCFVKNKTLLRKKKQKALFLFLLFYNSF